MCPDDFNSNSLSSKYGNVHRQLRALTILDFLIQNAGSRFQHLFADEPLLERLRIAATDPVSDQKVQERCRQLFAQWAASYKNTPGMERVTALYRQLPKRKQPAAAAKAKVLQDASNEQPFGNSVSISSGSKPPTVLSTPKDKSHKKKKEKKLSISSIPAMRRINIDKERPEILKTLASASVASTNLLNAIKLVNRETHRVSEDAEASTRFDQCRELRRKILRYIQGIESEEFLGSLIHANEELVTSLMAFEVLDKSVSYDSDSDEEDALEGNWTSGRRYNSDDNDMDDGFSKLSIKPPRPPRPDVFPSRHQQDDSETEPDSDDDEDNPFGDRNAIKASG